MVPPQDSEHPRQPIGSPYAAYGGVFRVVRTPREIYGLLERGSACRATGSTQVRSGPRPPPLSASARPPVLPAHADVGSQMNELSSRSHAVF
eukprot:SAG11_NODE_11981_length_728_cov_0.655008_2_plen_91_part_01